MFTTLQTPKVYLRLWCLLYSLGPTAWWPGTKCPSCPPVGSSVNKPRFFFEENSAVPIVNYASEITVSQLQIILVTKFFFEIKVSQPPIFAGIKHCFLYCSSLFTLGDRRVRWCTTPTFKPTQFSLLP